MNINKVQTKVTNHLAYDNTFECSQLMLNIFKISFVSHLEVSKIICLSHYYSTTEKLLDQLN